MFPRGLGPMACFQRTEQSSCYYCDGYRWVITIRMSLSFFSVFFHCASKVTEINSHKAQPAQGFSFEVGDKEVRRLVPMKLDTCAADRQLKPLINPTNAAKQLWG